MSESRNNLHSTDNSLDLYLGDLQNEKSSLSSVDDFQDWVMSDQIKDLLYNQTNQLKASDPLPEIAQHTAKGNINDSFFSEKVADYIFYDVDVPPIQEQKVPPIDTEEKPPFNLARVIRVGKRDPIEFIFTSKLGESEGVYYYEVKPNDNLDLLMSKVNRFSVVFDIIKKIQLDKLILYFSPTAYLNLKKSGIFKDNHLFFEVFERTEKKKPQDPGHLAKVDDRGAENTSLNTNLFSTDPFPPNIIDYIVSRIPITNEQTLAQPIEIVEKVPEGIASTIHVGTYSKTLIFKWASQKGYLRDLYYRPLREGEVFSELVNPITKISAIFCGVIKTCTIDSEKILYFTRKTHIEHKKNGGKYAQVFREVDIAANTKTEPPVILLGRDGKIFNLEYPDYVSVCEKTENLSNWMAGINQPFTPAILVRADYVNRRILFSVDNYYQYRLDPRLIISIPNQSVEQDTSETLCFVTPPKIPKPQSVANTNAQSFGMVGNIKIPFDLFMVYRQTKQKKNPPPENKEQDLKRHKMNPT